LCGQIPVAFLGVELHGKTANIALGVSRTPLTGHGGEARKQISFLADFGENLGSCVLGDVMSDGKGSIGTRTIRMHAPFGDDFAIKVGKLLQKPDILQKLGTPWPGSHYILVVDNRAAGIGG
jgi:hypothetical protein